MQIPFYIAAVIAIGSTALAISRRNAIYALLNLIVSLLAAAIVFLILGAPFVAALEVIVYAGAIMVVFVFAVMLLNAGRDRQSETASPGSFVLPGIGSAVLLAELIYLFSKSSSFGVPAREIGPKAVGLALYGPYVLAVELASLLLLSGLIGACRFGRHTPREANVQTTTRHTK